MKRFMNELQVPEKIYRARFNRYRKLQQIGSPPRILADAAWMLTQSFKPAPTHIKVFSWLYDNSPEWMKWLVSARYRKNKATTVALERLVDELDPETKAKLGV